MSIIIIISWRRQGSSFRCTKSRSRERPERSARMCRKTGNLVYADVHDRVSQAFKRNSYKRSGINFKYVRESMYILLDKPSSRSLHDGSQRRTHHALPPETLLASVGSISPRKARTVILLNPVGLDRARAALPPSKRLPGRVCRAEPAAVQRQRPSTRGRAGRQRAGMAIIFMGIFGNERFLR